MLHLDTNSHSQSSCVNSANTAVQYIEARLRCRPLGLSRKSVQQRLTQMHTSQAKRTLWQNMNLLGGSWLRLGLQHTFAVAHKIGLSH